MTSQDTCPVLSAARTSAPRNRSVFRSLWVIVLVALAIRLAVIPFLYTDQMNTEVRPANAGIVARTEALHDHFRFGYETGRIARSLVQGKGFSNPIYGDTGPTAMLPPLYPFIIAGFFRIFGIFTLRACLAILSFQALISALTCVPVYFIARKSFGERAAPWAAWGWALFPYAVYFPLDRIWCTWLATLILATLFLITLHLAESGKVSTWLGYGVLWAIAGLTEPMTLSVLVPLGCWACYRLHTRRQAWFKGAVVSALAFVLVVTPWFVRNYRVFHHFVPIRDGFGLSLILGTKPDVECVHWATYKVGVGPWGSNSEWEEFKRNGEWAYMKREQRLAFESIHNNPGWFAWQSLRRVVFLWTGYWSFDRSYLAEEPLDIPNIPFCTATTVLALLGLRKLFQRDRGLGWLYAMTMFFFPLIYYTTSPEDYYRRPLDTILVLLAIGYFAMRKEKELPVEREAELVAV